MKTLAQAFVTTNINEIDFENKTVTGVDTPVTMKDGKLHFEQGGLTFTIVTLKETMELHRGDIAERELSRFGFKHKPTDRIVDEWVGGNLTPENEIKYLVLVESDERVFGSQQNGTFYRDTLIPGIKLGGYTKFLAHDSDHTALNRWYFNASDPLVGHWDRVETWDVIPTSVVDHMEEIVSKHLDESLSLDPIRLYSEFCHEYQCVRVLYPEGEVVDLTEWYADEDEELTPYLTEFEQNKLFEKMVGTVPIIDDEEQYGDSTRTREWLKTADNLDRVIKYPIVQSFLLGE